MSSQIKMRNVEVSQRFVKELRGFVKLWDQPRMKSLNGNVTKQENKGFILHSSGQNIYVVNAGIFLDALNKTQTQMRVSWFGK